MPSLKQSVSKPKDLPKLDDGTRSFDITITQKVVQDARNSNIAKLAAKVEIKGFRKGKAPLNLVEEQLDKNKLYSAVLDEVIPPEYLKYLQANKLAPLTDPRITPTSMEDGKDWTFHVEIVVRPPVDLGKYQEYVKSALSEHAKTHPHDSKEKKAESDNHALSVVFDSLLQNAKLAVSPILIEEEAKNALSKLVNQLAGLKLNLDDYLKSMKKTQEELVKEYTNTAETNIKLELILGAVVDDLKPEVDDKEVASMNPQKGQEAYARYLVQKKKALDFLSGL